MYDTTFDIHYNSILRTVCCTQTREQILSLIPDETAPTSTKRRLWDIRNGDATSPTRRAIKSPVRNGQEHILLGIPRFPAIHLSELRDPLADEACAIAYNLLWNDVFLSVASMRCQPKTELPLNNSFKKKKTSLRWESVTCRRGSTIRI